MILKAFQIIFLHFFPPHCWKQASEKSMTLFFSHCVPNRSIFQPQTELYFLLQHSFCCFFFFDDSSLCLHRVSILFYRWLYEANIFYSCRQSTPLFDLLQNGSIFLTHSAGNNPPPLASVNSGI